MAAGFSLGRQRAAIEPHEQNTYGYGRDSIDPLIDAARDTLTSLLESSPDEAEHCLLAWSSSEHLLLRRLAIHGWAERSDVGADKKLNWFMNSIDIFDWPLRHEAMRLLAVALPEASQASGNAVVNHVKALRDVADDSERREWTIFRYVGWIAPTLPSPGSRSSVSGQHSKWNIPIGGCRTILTSWSGRRVPGAASKPTFLSMSCRNG